MLCIYCKLVKTESVATKKHEEARGENTLNMLLCSGSTESDRCRPVHVWPYCCHDANAGEFPLFLPEDVDQGAGEKTAMRPLKTKGEAT